MGRYRKKPSQYDSCLQLGSRGDEVVQKAALIVVDTDVFVRDLRYVRDREYKTNRRFLETLRKEQNGTTTIVNLLELCGILSFNLSPSQLKELFFYFPRRYRIQVLPIHTMEKPLPEVEIGKLFERMAGKMSFGDALVAAFIEKFIPGADLFVSWNARHFQTLKIPAVTPAQYLKR